MNDVRNESVESKTIIKLLINKLICTKKGIYIHIFISCVAGTTISFPHLSGTYLSPNIKGGLYG